MSVDPSKFARCSGKQLGYLRSIASMYPALISSVTLRSTPGTLLGTSRSFGRWSSSNYFEKCSNLTTTLCGMVRVFCACGEQTCLERLVERRGGVLD